MDIIRKMITVELKADSDGRVLQGVVGSTIDEDRDDDILDPKGCDLSEYETNPVFLADHRYSVDAIIGRTVNHQVTDKGVTFDVEFDMDDPEAARIAGKYQRKMARAVSVGFRGTVAQRRANLPSDHFAYKDGSYGIYFEKWTVREFSAVAIPANPNALAPKEAAALAAKGLRDDGLKAAVLDLVRSDEEFRSAIRGVIMSSSAKGQDSEEEPPSSEDSGHSLAGWMGSSQ